VNEYVTEFTQLSRYSPREVDTNEKKQECFLNGLNDGLAYGLEARDFENFQGMVNKALVLERKHKLVHPCQPGSSSRPCITTSLADSSILLGRSSSQSRRQLDKDFQSHSVK
jgi:hypothetical protein